MDEICKTIEEIAQKCFEDIKMTEKPYDTSFTELGMDSLMFVRMVVEVEESFGIEIPDELLLRSELDSVKRFAEVVCDLSSGK